MSPKTPCQISINDFVFPYKLSYNTHISLVLVCICPRIVLVCNSVFNIKERAQTGVF